MRLQSFHLSISESELRPILTHIEPHVSPLHQLSIQLLDGQIIVYAKIVKIVSIPVQITIQPFFESSFLVFRVNENGIKGKIKAAASHFILSQIASQFDPAILKYSNKRLSININNILQTLHIQSNCTIKQFHCSDKACHLELEGEMFVNMRNFMEQPGLS